MGERWWLGEKIRMGAPAEQLDLYIEGLEAASIRMDNRIEQLEAEVKIARLAALEEAARVAEASVPTHPHTNIGGGMKIAGQHIAAAIRALIDNPER